MPSIEKFRKSGLALPVAVILLVLFWVQAAAQTPPEDQVELGARLYSENCAVCHGQNGEGRVGATLAKDWPSIRPGLQVENTIRNGVEGSPMPAWSQENGGPLSDEEIEALVVYILSWETGGVPQLTPGPTATARPPISPVPEVEGDPNQGAVLFDQNCAVCHGPDGRGRVGANLARDWSSIRPDLQVKTTIEKGVEGSAMPAWSQENGGPLSEQEINHLVAFVVTLPNSEAQSPGQAPTPAVQINPFLGGLGGVVLLVVLFVVTVGIVLVAQKRR
ncbi:MAG: hypothetical protein EHM70_08140 [Chloroflexota bacterium]|nr:MAG: hypothetical protein EHM70_08140 [Chloroflexota bacterium]